MSLDKHNYGTNPAILPSSPCQPAAVAMHLPVHTPRCLGHDMLCQQFAFCEADAIICKAVWRMALKGGSGKAARRRASARQQGSALSLKSSQVKAVKAWLGHWGTGAPDLVPQGHCEGFTLQMLQMLARFAPCARAPFVSGFGTLGLLWPAHDLRKGGRPQKSTERGFACSERRASLSGWQSPGQLPGKQTWAKS